MHSRFQLLEKPKTATIFFMQSPSRTKLFLTCEHASNTIPKAYRHLFSPSRRVKGPWGNEKIQHLLNDHRGSDLGAARVAEALQQELRVPLYVYPVSRLFLEGNRYLQKSLFSVLISSLSTSEKEQLIQTYWLPHVQQIQNRIQRTLNSKATALHLGIHSFTPCHNGIERNCDVGILFNPQRSNEKDLAHRLQRELQQRLPEFRVRRNYPYAGTSEGLSKFFGKKFPDPHYLGIEIEINNKHIRKPTKASKALQLALTEAIKKII